MLWFSLGSDHCMFRYLCIVVVFSSFLFFWGLMQVRICGVFPDPHAQLHGHLQCVSCSWCKHKERVAPAVDGKGTEGY